MAEARIDKWMWAVRIFKTRTIAAEACKKGRITINGSLLKAASLKVPVMENSMTTPRIATPIA